MRGSVERLESRRLLSAYLKYDAKGVLRVFGTSGDDHLVVTFEPQYAYPFGGSEPMLAGYSPKVTSNGKELRNAGRLWHAYPRPVRVYLGAGNDTFTIANPEVEPKGQCYFIVDGGDGNDSIETGFGRDTIYGGAGADTIYSNRGNDLIEGGQESDDLRGGEGEDTLRGQNGHDRIRPGNGDADKVYGGVGNDRFYSAGAGSYPTFYGERGDDTLYSGLSQDAFHGGVGNDLVDYSGRDQDLLIVLIAFSDQQERLVPGLGENQPRLRNNFLWDDGRNTLNEMKSTRSDVYQPGDEMLDQFIVPDDQSLLYGTGALEKDSLHDVEQAIAGSGDDVMVGTHLRDIFHGGTGDDTIFAGGGADDCYGNAGDDLFFTVDTRDAFPTLHQGRHVAADLIDGGNGTDFARIDHRDPAKLRNSIEEIEMLPYTTS